MKRDFDDIINNLKRTINGYDYFVNFDKVYQNVSEIRGELDLLDSLIGDNENFDSDFVRLIHQHPDTLQALPALLAYSGTDMYVLADGETCHYVFTSLANTDEEYLNFVEKTGIKRLLTEGHIKNLTDYVIGVEAGLDSNARKNRSGHTMENLVEDYLRSFPEISSNVIPQATKEEIIRRFGYKELEEVNLSEGKSQADKRFDFAFKYGNIVFLVETNFYGSGGSKLNEVARSYEKLADDINKLPHYKFIWITDGIGWKSARHNLQESYTHQKLIMTLKDMEMRNLLDDIKEYIQDN